MEWILFLVLAFWIGMGAWWALQALLCRISPKYAVNRKLRIEQRANRIRAKHQAVESEYPHKATDEHTDEDLAAKLPVTQESVEMDIPLSAPVDKEPNFLEELRRQQQRDDEYERGREERRIAEQIRTQQLLDWALEHTAVPEARRHLQEKLDEVSDRLDHAHGSVTHYETMMSYRRSDEDDPEYIMYATRLAESKAEEEVLVQQVRKIRAALDAPLPEDSDQ